jgi:hypothetical protein
MGLAIACSCEEAEYDINPATPPDIRVEYLTHVLLVDILHLVEREDYPDLYRQAVAVSERGDASEDFRESHADALDEIHEEIPDYTEYDLQLRNKYPEQRPVISRMVAIILKPEKFEAWA